MLQEGIIIRYESSIVCEEAYSGTLTRPNSQLEIMFKLLYLALTRIMSHKHAQSRHCQVDTKFIISSYSPCNFTSIPQREDAKEYRFQKLKR